MLNLCYVLAHGQSAGLRGGLRREAVQWRVLSALLAYLLVGWVQVLMGGCQGAKALHLAKNAFIQWGNHEFILDAPT